MSPAVLVHLRRKRRRVFGDADHPRLTVFRSHRHISCQLIDDDRRVTLAAAGTGQKSVREQLDGSSGNQKAAAVVGRVMAEKARELGFERIRFDRNGYQYHGRVKALVEAAREAGLKL